MPPPPPGPAPGGRWYNPGLRSVGDFLSASFGLMARTIMPLLPLLIAVAVPVVLSFVAADSALGLTDWFDEFSQQAVDLQPNETLDVPDLDASSGEIWTWAIILVTVNIAATILVSIAGIVTLWAVHSGESPSTGDIVRLSARAIIPLMGLAATAFVIYAAVAVVLVGMIAIAPPIAIIAVLALFPLTFWVMARFALALPISVVERRGASAFSRSYALTSGHGWGVLGRLLLFVLILSFGLQIVSFPLSFLSFLGSAALVIGTILSFLVNLAAAAAAQAGPIILYADLVDTDAQPAHPIGWGQPV
ncbi:MAG TPA: hypothetical protein VMW08_06170 [Acidimicrobiales bacterium]|nr:hypothetical protein [Acidimicrobiales bacterium]